MKVATIRANNTPKPLDIWLVRRWAAATALGYLVLTLAYWAVNAFRPSSYPYYDFWSVPLLVSMIVGQGTVGIAQGAVLRQYVVNFQSLKWAAYTLLSFTFTIALAGVYILIPSVVPWLQGQYSGSDYADYDMICALLIVAPCLQGIFTGLIQARLLKLLAPQYASWIIVNVISIVPSALIVAIAIAFQLHPTNMPLLSPLIAAVGGAFAGAVTGTALLRLLGLSIQQYTPDAPE